MKKMFLKFGLNEMLSKAQMREIPAAKMKQPQVAQLATSMLMILIGSLSRAAARKTQLPAVLVTQMA